MDTRQARDSKVIEELGTYDPIHSQPEKQVVLKRDRVEYWLGVGAQPSPTVRGLLNKQGITTGTAAPPKARAAKRPGG